MDKLLFGTAGLPHISKGKKYYEAAADLKKLNLDAMEIEFVYGVRMKEEETLKVKAAGEKNNIVFTVHAPYYINLASKEEEKQEASIKRITDSLHIADLINAFSVTFHAGFYQDLSKTKVYRDIKKGVQIIQEQNPQAFKKLAPETTGKISQFGSLDEIIKLSNETGIRFCVDFAHLYARSLGAINSYRSFLSVLDRIQASSKLKDPLKNMHIHISGIQYSRRSGEIRHEPLVKSKFRWKDLLRAFRKTKVSGIVICESPELERDALLLKEYI